MADFTHKEVGITVNQYGNFVAQIGDKEQLVDDTLRGIRQKIDNEFAARVIATKTTTSLKAVGLVSNDYARAREAVVRTISVTGLHRVQSSFITSPATPTSESIQYALPASPENAALLRFFEKVRKLHETLRTAVQARDIKPKVYGRIASEEYPDKIAEMNARYKTVSQLPAIELTAAIPEMPHVADFEASHG